MDKIHMSPTRAFKFSKNPLRALDDSQAVNDGSKWAFDYFGGVITNEP
ncbi:unnamed protein product [Fructobacillus evanidus]|uniref:Uncharacterized protein n=1 Tax=Fructobacillus evanidus TaxID=3064281 RepID=A0ABM9N002_9LACO|nr:unnamed protein product [Fructobacillus sp. LMG 32999]